MRSCNAARSAAQSGRVSVVPTVVTSIGEGYRIAVDLDLAKFFDNVEHDVLMARVGRKVGDKRLPGLIGKYLRAGVLVGETLQATEVGTPQGGPLTLATN